MFLNSPGKKKAENKTVYRDKKKENRKAASATMWQQQQLSATEMLKLASFLLNVQPRAPPHTGVTAEHVSSTSALSTEFIQ